MEEKMKKFHKHFTMLLIMLLSFAVFSQDLVFSKEESTWDREAIKKNNDKSSLIKIHHSIKCYLEEYERKRILINEEMIRGESHSLIEDAAQALGQIVVDKATTVALNVLKKRVRKLLNEIHFSKTCQVIDNIRFQELITARNVLYKAFIQDLLIHLRSNLNAEIKNKKEKAKEQNKEEIESIQYLDLLDVMVMEVLFQKISDSKKLIGAQTINQIFEGFVNFYLGQKALSNSSINTPYLKRKYCVVLAVLSVWKAKSELSGNQYKDLSITKIFDTILDSLKQQLKDKGFELEKNSPLYFKTLNIAYLLHAATTSTNKGELMPGKLNSIVDALFEAVFFIEGIDVQSEKERHNGKVGKDDKDQKWKWHLIILKDIINAAINKDINSIINTACVALNSEDDNKAVRLIGAVLLYAQTYTDKELLKDREKAQIKRTEILRSLVMDRVENPRGTIFSFGGSVKWNSKYEFLRVSDVDDKKYAPFSVTLGLGLDSYISKAFNLHFEFGIFDLGRFTSYSDDTGEVSKPALTDIFSPSITVGWFCLAPRTPIYVGLTYCNSPWSIETGIRDSKIEKYRIRLTLGIYIPLFDF
jgi:hypothetical protein